MLHYLLATQSQANVKVKYFCTFTLNACNIHDSTIPFDYA